MSSTFIHCYLIHLFIRLLNYRKSSWIHLNCALWSNDVYETRDGSLANVQQICKRAQDAVRTSNKILPFSPCKNETLIIFAFLVSANIYMYTDWMSRSFLFKIVICWFSIDFVLIRPVIFLVTVTKCVPLENI